MVNLHFKIDKFSWNQNFYIIDSLPFDAILGVTSLKHCNIILDFFKSVIKFYFEPSIEIPFAGFNSNNRIINTICEARINMSAKQTKMLDSLIKKYKCIFSEIPGLAKDYEYKIKLKDNIPVCKAPYYLAPDKAKLLDQHIQQLVKQGILSVSNSNYSSPVFFVKKKDDSYRLVADYRFLNKHIEFDPMSSANINHIFASLGNSKVYTLLDMKSAFHQIKLSEDTKHVTAIVTQYGTWHYNRCPFGLSVSSQALSRFLNSSLAEFRHSFLLIYYDDLIVHSSDVESHLKHLNLLFTKIKTLGITINIDKARFCMSRVRLLGSVISAEGRFIDPLKVQAINEMPIPKNVKEVMRLVGAAAFYARYIPMFSQIVAPLNDLKKKNIKFKITNVHLEAISTLKKALTNAPVLKHPDFERTFVLQTDGSSTGLGAVLLQKYEDGLHPIMYCSRKLNSAELRYNSHELEMLAVITALDKFKDFLTDRHFILQTDCRSLLWIFNTPNKFNKLSRWILKISRYDFTPEHIKAEHNKMADFLSRLYESNDTIVNSENKLEQKSNDKFVKIKELHSADPGYAILIKKITSSLDPSDLDLLSEQIRNDVQLNSLNVINNTNFDFLSIKQEQRNSPECEIIYRNLKAKMNVPNFCIKDGLVFKLVGRNHLKRILLPESLLNYVLRYFHDSKYAAHCSVIKTFREISKIFYYKKLYAKVRDYVRTCKVCQAIRPYTRNDKVQLSSSIPEFTFHTLYVDFIGPIIKSPENYKYIFSVVDGYSKFAFAYPCKKQTTDTAISMMQKIFLQNGYATVVVSDNGPAFSSVKWKTFLFNNGIRASYCSSYTPSSNKSECLNKQIKYNLGCILKEYSIQHKNWSKFLNFVIFNYNNSFKNTINTTPAEVYFGRKLITPFIIINELTNLVTSSVKPSQQQINDALKLAHQQRLNRTLNRPSVSKYRIGQLVMVKNLAPNINKNKSAKFTAKYNGPYKIQKFTSPTSVRLKPTNSHKSTFGMSIYNLRPYYT